MSFELDATERLFIVPDPSGNGKQALVSAKQGASGPEVQFYVPDDDGDYKFVGADEYFDDHYKGPEIKKGARAKALETFVNNWRGNRDATHTFTWEAPATLEGAAQTVVELGQTLTSKGNADNLKVNTPVTVFYTPKGETEQTTWSLDYEWDAGAKGIKIKNNVPQEVIDGKKQEVKHGKVYPVTLQSNGSIDISRNAATSRIDINGKGRDLKLNIGPEIIEDGVKTGRHEFTLELNYDGAPLKTKGTLVQKAGKFEFEYAQEPELRIGSGATGKLAVSAIIGNAGLQGNLDEAFKQVTTKDKYKDLYSAFDSKLSKLRAGVPLVLQGPAGGYMGRENLRQVMYLDNAHNIHIGTINVQENQHGALQVVGGISNDQSITSYLRDESTRQSRSEADIAQDLAKELKSQSAEISRDEDLRIVGKFNNNPTAKELSEADKAARFKRGKPETNYITVDELNGRVTQRDTGASVKTAGGDARDINVRVDVKYPESQPSAPLPVQSQPQTPTPTASQPVQNTPAPMGLGGTALLGGVGAIVGGIIGGMANNPTMGAVLGGVIGLIATQIPAVRDIANRIVGHTNNQTIQNTYNNVMNGGPQMQAG